VAGKRCRVNTALGASELPGSRMAARHAEAPPNTGVYSLHGPSHGTSSLGSIPAGGPLKIKVIRRAKIGTAREVLEGMRAIVEANEEPRARPNSNPRRSWAVASPRCEEGSRAAKNCDYHFADDQSTAMHDVR
jgi:hypothetical protein